MIKAIILDNGYSPKDVVVKFGNDGGKNDASN